MVNNMYAMKNVFVNHPNVKRDILLFTYSTKPSEKALSDILSRYGLLPKNWYSNLLKGKKVHINQNTIYIAEKKPQ